MRIYWTLSNQMSWIDEVERSEKVKKKKLFTESACKCRNCVSFLPKLVRSCVQLQSSSSFKYWTLSRTLRASDSHGLKPSNGFVWSHTFIVLLLNQRSYRSFVILYLTCGILFKRIWFCWAFIWTPLAYSAYSTRYNSNDICTLF